MLTRLQACGEIEMNPSALMSFMTDRIDDATLAQAPSLRIVSCALKGHDAYDVDACTRRGIWVSIVPDLLTEPTAELAIGLAIALGRHVREGDSFIRNQTYQGWRAHLYGAGLKDAIVAVLGQGRVGSAIVDRLAGFACGRLLGVDPAAHHPDVVPATLDEAFAASDVVFVAAHLGSAVRGVRLAIEHRAADNILAALAGTRPADAINQPVGVST